MLLDRGLTVELLDLAYEIAVVDPNPRTNRKRLTIALRDLVSEQEAEGKTKKCLTRAWLNPPPEAAEMIRWALENDVQRPMRRIMHFGALLATFPFAGNISRVIGQHLQTEGQVASLLVRAEARRALGDRSSVEVAARKTYTTLRNLGVLVQSGQTLTGGPAIVISDPGFAAWLAHAVLLTRQVESLPLSSLSSAPELLGLTLSVAPSASYPMLESHSQGAGSVFVRRDSSDCA